MAAPCNELHGTIWYNTARDRETTSDDIVQMTLDDLEESSEITSNWYVAYIAYNFLLVVMTDLDGFVFL